MFMGGHLLVPVVNKERFRLFEFVDLQRPTLSKLNDLGRSSFKEDWQTIDKRLLTLYPIGWSKDQSRGLQIDMFSTLDESSSLPFEFAFSLQDYAVVRFIGEGLNRIMTPARFLIGARNSPVPTPIKMELVALGGKLVPRLELDLERAVRPKKEPYRKPKWR